MRRRLPLITFLLAALAVVGIAPAGATVGPIDFSPSSPIAFGNQPVTTTSDPITVTISNAGDEAGTVTIGGTDAAKFDAVPSASNGCSGMTVPAAGSCAVDVTFAPGGAPGSYGAELDVLDSFSAVSGSANLTGTGTAASVSVSPASPFDFGDRKVGTTGTQQFTITNSGHGNLSSLSVGVSGTGFSKIALDDGCSGTVVAPSDTCTFTVQFQPGSTGAQSGSVSITSNDPNSPEVVSLSGNGTAGLAEASPSPLSFATPINGSDTQTITLSNSGEAPLVVQSAVLTGDATFTKIVTTTPCVGSPIAAGSQCTVDIKFSPDSTAAQSATLTFTDDSGGSADSKQAVAITGTVLIPGIRSDPPSVGFEVLPVGRLSNPITATITNTGQATLTIGSVAIGGVNYKSFKLGIQTCTQTAIAPGDTCTINVKFAPTKLGARVAILLVRNDAGGSPSTLNVALTGTGVRPPSVTALRAATGCTDVRLTWHNPNAIGFVRVQVVRNSAHTPRGPFDGVIVKHTTGAVTDTGLTQFQSYHYALYAVYTSFDHSHLVFSAADAAAVRTGRICTPRNGSLISDLSPPVDWTPYPGARLYAYILQRFGHTILVRYPKRSQTTVPSSWTFNGQSKSIQHGGVYSFYLYAYTSGRPKGFLIGVTVFTEQ
jgi:hypothetical protein